MNPSLEVPCVCKDMQLHLLELQSNQCRTFGVWCMVYGVMKQKVLFVAIAATVCAAICTFDAIAQPPPVIIWPVCCHYTHAI